MTITNDIRYVGVNDHKVDLFEGQYVVPNGMAYNSYVIMDEKIAVMDTVDQNFGAQWLHNLDVVLGDREPDFLVVQHMEPDHSANIDLFLHASSPGSCSRGSTGMLLAMAKGNSTSFATLFVFSSSLETGITNSCISFRSSKNCASRTPSSGAYQNEQFCRDKISLDTGSKNREASWGWQQKYTLPMQPSRLVGLCNRCAISVPPLLLGFDQCAESGNVFFPGDFDVIDTAVDEVDVVA